QPQSRARQPVGLVRSRGDSGWIDDTHIARAHGRGDAGLLRLPEHRLIQLPVALHATLQNLIPDRLLGFRADVLRLFGVGIPEQFFPALGLFVFVGDAFDYAGALLLDRGLQARDLGLHALRFVVLGRVCG